MFHHCAKTDGIRQGSEEIPQRRCCCCSVDVNDGTERTREKLLDAFVSCSHTFILPAQFELSFVCPVS